MLSSIPRNTKWDINSSDNQRCITPPSALGKALDLNVISRYPSDLSSSDIQFAFKPKHPTFMCTTAWKDINSRYTREALWEASYVWSTMVIAVGAKSKFKFEYTMRSGRWRAARPVRTQTFTHGRCHDSTCSRVNNGIKTLRHINFFRHCYVYTFIAFVPRDHDKESSQLWRWSWKHQDVQFKAIPSRLSPKPAKSNAFHYVTKR